MPAKHGSGSPRGVVSATLEERVSYLEHMKSFQDEMVKIIRIYTSNEAFTSERCLQEMVNFIARKFSLYVVSVLLVDEISRELVLYVSAGEESMTPVLKNYRIAIGSGLSGTAAKTGEALLVNDVTKDARFLSGPLKKTLSEMCIPIKIKHRIAGILDLQDDTKNRFKKDFSRLMEDIALNIGFVLENKQLYDDLKQTNELLEKRFNEKVRELRKSEERFRIIVENATDPIFTTDHGGNFTWANRTACVRLGFTDHSYIGENLVALIREGSVHPVYTALRKTLRGEIVQPFQVEIRTKAGEDRTVEFSCVGIREGDDIIGMEAGLRDVTDRVVVEKLKKNYTSTLEAAVVERTSEIKEIQRASILAIANLAESIDDDTGGHLDRIRHYCRTLSEDMRANSPYRDEIHEGYSEMLFDLSPLHDLGKVGIRDHILQKPARLTDDEFEKMKNHADIGARALRKAGEMINSDSFFTTAEMIARFHHEKWDGTGYPPVEINGDHRPLRELEIPLCARIVAVADVYDALTSKRPYKEAYAHERAKNMIVTQSGKHFDPEVVKSFLRSEAEFLAIRRRFPDTSHVEEKPFELPAPEQG
jgi:PAS domain S-box-containing protein